MKTVAAFLKRHASLLLIIASILAVTAISLGFYVHASVRLDESQSLWQTSRSVRGVIAYVAKDVHVPGYHLILHYWQILFGQSIEVARALSLVFFILSIPAFYLLARQVLKINWARLALLGYAFSPFMLWYANEARMYTFLALVAILSQYFFVRLLQRKSGWIGYTLVAMIGIYVHYFFIFNLLVQGIFFLVNRKAFAKGSLLKFIGIAALLVIEFAPWLYFFKMQGSGSGLSPKLAAPTTIDFFNALSQFAFGFQTDAVNTVLLSLWPILMAGALLFIRTRVVISRPVAYMMTAALLPIVIAFAVSVTIRPFFISRYMVSSLPALIIAFAWILAQYPKVLGKVFVGLAAAVIVATSAFQITSPLTPVKEDYRAASAFVSAHASPHDVVVLSTPFTLYPYEYEYKIGPASIRTLQAWDGRATTGIPAFDEKTLPAQVTALADGHHDAYVLLSYDQGNEATVKKYFDAHYMLKSQHEYSRGLTLYVYELHADTAPRLSQLPYALKIQVPQTETQQ